MNYEISDEKRLDLVECSLGPESWLVGRVKLNYTCRTLDLQAEASRRVDGVEALKELLDEHAYQYVITYYDGHRNRLHLLRDFTGCEPGYYALSGEQLFVSDNASKVAKELSQQNDICEQGAFCFVYCEMHWKPSTLYKSVKSILNECIYTFDPNAGDFRISDHFSVPLESEAETFDPRTLRENICLAHERRIGDRNSIYLSGGIDSQVMAITLIRDLGIRDTESVHFTVKGNQTSEVEFAKNAAKQLGIPFQSVEIDPCVETCIDQRMLDSNSPYIGTLLLQEAIRGSASQQTTFFGGQDTRLHTPALSRADLLYWQFASMLDGSLLVFPWLFARLATFLGAHSVLFRDVERRSRLKALLDNIYPPQKFWKYRHFHIHPFDFALHQLNSHAAFQSLEDSLKELRNDSHRSRYNKLVMLNWRKQYLFDMEYMVESTRTLGHDCVLPFYDRRLAKESAKINFSIATQFSKGRAGHSSRRMLVNKYCLREAYKNELTEELIFRDKAVSPSASQFFNGGLAGEVSAFITDNPLRGTALGEALHVEKLIDIAKRNELRWSSSDNGIITILFNAIVVAKLYAAS